MIRTRSGAGARNADPATFPDRPATRQDAHRASIVSQIGAPFRATGRRSAVVEVAGDVAFLCAFGGLPWLAAVLASRAATAVAAVLAGGAA